ncbi:MAG: AAA family ATPase [Candidatus Asgardarchaeia archaeon]
MILSLKVENWGNKDSFEVSFKEGLNLVFGPNYSGKSSLLNAIFYGFIGELPVSISPKDMVKKGTFEAVVELEFLGKDSQKYKISRRIIVTKAKKQRETAFLYALSNGKPEEIASGKAVNNKVIDLLGIEPIFFKRAIFMREGDIYRILTKSERGIQDELSRLLGADKIICLSKVARKLSKELDKNIKGLETKLAELSETGEVASVEQLEEKLSNVEKRLTEINEQIQQKEEIINNLKSELQKHDEVMKLERQIEDLRKQMEYLVKGFPGEGSFKERIESVLSEKQKELEELENRKSQLERDISGLTAKIDTLRDNLKKLEGATVCPTCERPLSPEEAQKIINRKKQKIEENQQLIAQKNDELKEVKRLINSLKKELIDLKEREVKVSQIFENVVALNEKKSKLKNELKSKRDELEANIKMYENEIKDLKTEQHNLLIEKGQLKAMIASAKERKVDILNEILDFVHKRFILDIFSKACEKTAEQIISETIRLLEDDLADMWGKIHGGIWQAELDKDLFPKLKRNGLEYVPEQLSSAEKCYFLHHCEFSCRNILVILDFLYLTSHLNI